MVLGVMGLHHQDPPSGSQSSRDVAKASPTFMFPKHKMPPVPLTLTFLPSPPQLSLQSEQAPLPNQGIVIPPPVKAPGIPIGDQSSPHVGFRAQPRMFVQDVHGCQFHDIDSHNKHAHPKLFWVSTDSANKSVHHEFTSSFTNYELQVMSMGICAKLRYTSFFCMRDDQFVPISTLITELRVQQNYEDYKKTVPHVILEVFIVQRLNDATACP